MATTGLSDVYIADITEDSNGYETYSTPEKLADSISADFTINRTKSEMYASDKLFDKKDEFTDGSFTFGAAAITSAMAAKITGATVDSNGLLIDASEDEPPAKAVGFKSKMTNGNYRFIWLYRVQFSYVKESFKTKEKTVSYSTPSIEGTILQRNKPDSRGKHPWRVSVNEGESQSSASAISSWFSAVPPEPTFAANQQQN